MLIYKNKVTRARIKNRPAFEDELLHIVSGYAVSLTTVEFMNELYLVGNIQPVHPSEQGFHSD